MKTLRQKRDEGKRQKFVGRLDEFSLFKSLVEASEPSKNILMIWGVGGVGKSTLLRLMMDEAAVLNFLGASVDVRTVQTPIDFLTTWYSQFLETAQVEGITFRQFEQKLNEFRSIQSKLSAAAGSIGQGLFKALEATGPFGAFAVGALGEDRVKSWLNNVLTKPEIDFFLSAEDRLTKHFVDGLNLLLLTSKVILLIDTYEQASPEIDSWLRSQLVNDLSTDSLIVIAGRDPLEKFDPAWSEWSSLIYSKELERLSEDDARSYLNHWGIHDDELVRKIMSSTGNLPWALELTVESLASLPDISANVSETAEFHEIERKVVSRFLTQISEDRALQRLVEICAVLRCFDQDILDYLVGDDSSSRLKDLRKYSLCRIRDDGKYMLHDNVREFTEGEFMSVAPKRWRELHKKAADYYRAFVSNCTPLEQEWQSCILELLYHTSALNETEATSIMASYCRSLTGPLLTEHAGPFISVLEGRVHKQKNQAIINFYKGQIKVSVCQLEAAKNMLELVIGEETAPDQVKLAAYASLCDVLHRQGNVLTSLQIALSGLKLAQQLDIPESAGLLAARAAEMYGSQGNLLESQKYCSICESSLLLIDDQYIAAQVHLLLADVLLFRAANEEGTRNLQSAIAKWTNVGDKYGIARANISLSWLYSLTGDSRKGLLAAKEACEFFRGHQDYYHLGLATLNCAELHRIQGDMSASIDLNREAIGLLRSVGSTLYEAIASYQLGRTCFEDAQVSEAIKVLEYVLELEGQVDDRYTIGLSQLYLALSHDALGQNDQALEYFMQAKLVLEAAQNKYGIALFYVQRGGLALRDNDWPTFSSDLSAAENIAEDWNYMDILAKIHYLKGQHMLNSYQPSTIEDKIRERGIVEEFLTAMTTAARFNQSLLNSVIELIIEAVRGRLTELSLSPRDAKSILGELNRSWRLQQHDVTKGQLDEKAARGTDSVLQGRSVNQIDEFLSMI